MKTKKTFRWRVITSLAATATYVCATLMHVGLAWELVDVLLLVVALVFGFTVGVILDCPSDKASKAGELHSVQFGTRCSQCGKGNYTLITPDNPGYVRCNRCGRTAKLLT